MKIKKILFEYVSPGASKENRLKAAAGDALLTSDELVTALVILSFDKDEDVASSARSNFELLPLATSVRALTVDLDPFVIEELYRVHSGARLLLDMIVVNDNTPEHLLMEIAGSSVDSVLSILAHSDKMAGNAELLEAVKGNSLAQPATIAVSEKTFASSPAKTHSAGTSLSDSLLDDTDEDVDEEDEKNIFKKISSMSMVQKIKLAMTGNREARNILIKDSNKVILQCVIKNPRITEEEVANIAASKTIADEILRQISNSKEWTRNYNVKRCLVFNSKTPIPIGLKFLNFMREKDVKILSTSRAVSNALRSAAMRRLAQLKSV